MKFLSSRIILGIVLILLGLSWKFGYSRQDSNPVTPALESVKIHYTSKLPIKLRNPEKQFRYRKLDPTVVEAIEAEILNQLNREGY